MDLKKLELIEQTNHFPEVTQLLSGGAKAPYLVFVMTVLFYRINKLAGLIQIPYMIWLGFAAYLNFGVWFLNR